MDTNEATKAADQIIRDHFLGDEDPPAGLEDAIYDAILDATTGAAHAVLDEMEAAVAAARLNY